MSFSVWLSLGVRTEGCNVQIVALHNHQHHQNTTAGTKSISVFKLKYHTIKKKKNLQSYPMLWRRLKTISFKSTSAPWHLLQIQIHIMPIIKHVHSSEALNEAADIRLLIGGNIINLLFCTAVLLIPNGLVCTRSLCLSVQMRQLMMNSSLRKLQNSKFLEAKRLACCEQPDFWMGTALVTGIR